MKVYGIGEGYDWEGSEIRKELYTNIDDALAQLKLEAEFEHFEKMDDLFWRHRTDGSFIFIKEFKIKVNLDKIGKQVNINENNGNITL